MRPTLLWGSFASGSFFVYCPPIFWAADGTEMTCFILLSEVQCRQSEIWKTLPVPVGKRHRQGLGSVSDHRPHHTPPRTTRKQHGQRGPKMKWSGAETAKNGRKCSKKVSGACSHPRGRGFESHQVHQRSTAILIQWVSRLRCFLFAQKPWFQGSLGFWGFCWCPVDR